MNCPYQKYYYWNYVSKAKKGKKKEGGREWGEREKKLSINCNDDFLVKYTFF